jgi:hypothetical protein
MSGRRATTPTKHISETVAVTSKCPRKLKDGDVPCAILARVRQKQMTDERTIPPQEPAPSCFEPLLFESVRLVNVPGLSTPELRLPLRSLLNAGDRASRSVAIVALIDEQDLAVAEIVWRRGGAVWRMLARGGDSEKLAAAANARWDELRSEGWRIQTGKLNAFCFSSVLLEGFVRLAHERRLD